jgi:hypothetical protein
MRSMAPLFRFNDDADKSKTGTRQFNERQRLILLGAAALILVIAAGFSILLTSGGTPLERCRGIALSQQRDSCLASLAESTSNLSVCSYLNGSAGYEYSCVSSIALKSLNVSYCSELSHNSSYYAQCVSGISNQTGNIGYCSLISEPYRSQCEYSIAENGNFSDSSLCGTISNSSLQANCEYRSNYRVAFLQKNPGYCSALPAYQNYSLLSYMLNIGSPEHNITSYISFLNTTPQQYCRYSIAIESYNRSLCGSVGGYLSLVCSYSLGEVNVSNSTNITISNAGTLCSSAGSEEQLCTYAVYAYIALKNDNATICGAVASPLLQYSCYAALAKKYNFPSYCGLISNKSISNVCYSNLTSNSSQAV